MGLGPFSLHCLAAAFFGWTTASIATPEAKYEVTTNIYMSPMRRTNSPELFRLLTPALQWGR